MALPASGNPISINQIRAEMSNPNGSLKVLSTTDVNAASSARPDGNTPHQLSEFYSYDHSASNLTRIALFGPDQEAGELCGETPNTNFYHDGGGDPFANSVVYYQNDDASGAVAEAGFYIYGNGSAGIAIGGDGKVVGAFDC